MRHRHTRCKESANIDSHALKHTHSCKTTSVSHTHVHNSPRTSITSLISELPRTCSATAALCTYSFWTTRQNEFIKTQHTSKTFAHALHHYVHVLILDTPRQKQSTQTRHDSEILRMRYITISLNMSIMHDMRVVSSLSERAIVTAEGR